VVNRRAPEGATQPGSPPPAVDPRHTRPTDAAPACRLHRAPKTTAKHAKPLRHKASRASLRPPPPGGHRAPCTPPVGARRTRHHYSRPACWRVRHERPHANESAQATDGRLRGGRAQGLADPASCSRKPGRSNASTSPATPRSRSGTGRTCQCLREPTRPPKRLCAPRTRPKRGGRRRPRIPWCAFASQASPEPAATLNTFRRARTRPPRKCPPSWSGTAHTASPETDRAPARAGPPPGSDAPVRAPPGGGHDRHRPRHSAPTLGRLSHRHGTAAMGPDRNTPADTTRTPPRLCPVDHGGSVALRWSVLSRPLPSMNGSTDVETRLSGGSWHPGRPRLCGSVTPPVAGRDDSRPPVSDTTGPTDAATSPTGSSVDAAAPLAAPSAHHRGLGSGRRSCRSGWPRPGGARSGRRRTPWHGGPCSRPGRRG